ncbi:MAG: SGNH/GDSL hydrolase family protein [Bradyrhizobium sp.]
MMLPRFDTAGLTIAPAVALAGLVLLTAPSARAQSAAQAAPRSQPSASSQSASKAAPVPNKSLAGKTIDKVRRLAQSASGIFSRVPCLPPEGGVQPLGSLPHIAGRLASGQPAVIVAFGSSSTQGYGASSLKYTYPNRLAAQLRRQYPTAQITVINAGIGGEAAPQMMKRLKSAVIDVHPDLVIWQVGTNAVLRHLDPGAVAKLVQQGVARIQVAGSDVVLVGPQYSPAMTAHRKSTGRIVELLARVAQLRHIGIFPRFKVMREWHTAQDLPVSSFVIADGLHMNDWGYACFAQLLGDDIIRSVGQIKAGIKVPATVLTYQPM